jgi:phosphoglycolate phosphatase
MSLRARAVVWDLDGTLISVGSDPLVPFWKALGSLGIDSSALTPITVHGKTDLGICAELIQVNGLDRKYGLDPSVLLGAVDQVTEFEARELLADRRVLPGVHESLNDAIEAGFLNVLATGNSRTRARIKLVTIGLWTRFAIDLSVFGDEVTLRQELLQLSSRRITDYFATRVAGHRRPAIVVVGDTPLDIEAGRPVGRTIAVASGGYSKDELEAARPDLLIDSLASGRDQVVALLKSTSSV